MSAASKGGSGAYTADFTLADTGDYLVTVTGVAPPGSSGTSGVLDGSPYLLSIVPGATSVFHSTAEGPGISAPQVGRLMWVAVTARDMYANARTQGGDRFALALEGPNSTRLSASSVVDYGNGTVAYGGFVEPHVWGCALAPAGDGLVATADAPAPRGCGLRVEDAIGISSWFAGGALASFRRLPEFANAHLGVERAAYAGGRSRRRRTCTSRARSSAAATASSCS